MHADFHRNLSWSWGVLPFLIQPFNETLKHITDRISGLHSVLIMTNEQSDQPKYSILVLAEDLGRMFCVQQNRGDVQEAAAWLTERTSHFSAIVQDMTKHSGFQDEDLDSLCSMF